MGFLGCRMFKIWDDLSMECSRCGMFITWDVQDLFFFLDGRYSGCVMLGIRDFRFEEYLGCRAFGMQHLECWMFAGV